MSDVEKIILQNIDPKFKYIARDDNGDLYVFTKKPRNEYGMWVHEDCDIAEMFMFNHLFKNVSWEDEEPTLIADLL